MITAVALALFALAPQAKTYDFALDLKKGQQLQFVVGIATPGGKAEGNLILTVDAADEKAVTVSWPQIVYSGGMEPHKAGRYKIDPKGRISGEGKMPDACFYLLQMALPTKAVAVGEEFSIKYAFGDSNMDLKGKLVKVDSNLATFSLSGVLHTLDGGDLAVTEESVFDLTKKYVVSGTLTMTKYNMKFYFKPAVG